MEQDFAATANLIAEPTRAVILLKLLNGKALPAGELAAAANVSAQTASGHLAKLLQAKFLRVETQGRHRYYCLSGTEIADALEAMLVLLPGARKDSQRETQPNVGTLAYARTCYSHIAGWLGVRIADGLQNEGFIRAERSKRFVMTAEGQYWFTNLGVPISNAYGRQCLDWTERRPHLAGPLGVALYRRFLGLGWLASINGARNIRVTQRGKRELWDQLRIPLS
jgi:DNA-binding transcriptional ArsR family regulator